MKEDSPLNNATKIPTTTKTITIRGYTNLEDLGDSKEVIIRELQDFYLGERKAGRTDLMQIFRDFRRNYELDRGIWFNPFPMNIKGWIKKWENTLPVTMRQVKLKSSDAKKPKETAAALVKEIAYHDLEDGAKNLQSLLLEDAQKLMSDSNKSYEMMDANGGLWEAADFHKIQLKRKEVALAIAEKVLSGVQKHELIDIKKNKEGRETAGFLMDFMKQATSGELSEQDLELLEQGVPQIA